MFVTSLRHEDDSSGKWEFRASVTPVRDLRIINFFNLLLCHILNLMLNPSLERNVVRGMYRITPYKAIWIAYSELMPLRL